MANFDHNLNRCYSCNVICAPRALRRIVGNEEKIQILIRFREDLEFDPAPFLLHNRICINCDRLADDEIEELHNNPDCTYFNVIKQTDSSSCIICNNRIADNISRIPKKARIQIFIDLEVLVPPATRCCLRHLDINNNLKIEYYNVIRFIRRPYKLVGSELIGYLKIMREMIKDSNKNKRDFSKLDSYTEEEFSIVSPVTKDQFNVIRASCQPVEYGGNLRYISEKYLMTFLFKMRLGMSDDVLSVIFNYSSRQYTGTIISLVRHSLMIQFVPESIGFNSITREDFILQHVSPFHNELYNQTPASPKVIVIADASYIDIHKSKNFESLRQSFSLHKSRHLLKPMVIVAPDGFILHIIGPYFSDTRNNDASMITDIFEKNYDGIEDFFEQGDVFLLDRGFRDSIHFLENRGYFCKMPPFLERNRRQFNTVEANESRLITKSRWAVETRNGHLQSIFRFFRQTVPYAHILNLQDFYQIAGAIINRFHPVLIMPEATLNLARELLQRVNDVNVVQARVEVENLHRARAIWRVLNHHHAPDFPIFGIDYLKELTVGKFQIELAPSYIQDKTNREHTDVFEFDEYLGEPGFLRMRIFSRYVNRTKHQLWISYTEPELIDEDNSPIMGYYCTCKTGARTIGTCAHVTSVLWFLGYARHYQGIKFPSTDLLYSVMDAANRH